jgi:carbon monoxide dehydrogenase subunit G
MATSVVEDRYEASADRAWQLVGDFSNLKAVSPAIEDVEITGDDRTFSMLGMRITERLVSIDESSRSITYSIVDGVPIESHEATITVTPDGEGCTITWSVTATPDEATPLFADTYRSALRNLHTQLDD